MMQQVLNEQAALPALIRKAVVASHMEFFEWKPIPEESLTDEAVEQHLATCTSCNIQVYQLGIMLPENRSTHDRQVMARARLLEERPEIGLRELLILTR